MAPILRFVASSGSKTKEPRYAGLSEARASHYKERGQDQPNRIIAKFGLSSTSATSGCTVPLKCYTVCTTLCLTAIISRPPSHTICLFLHSHHLRPHLTHFSVKFLNIGVNDLCGSHHQPTTRHIQTSLPLVVVVNCQLSTITHVQHRPWTWFPSLEVPGYYLDGQTTLRNSGCS